MICPAQVKYTNQHYRKGPLSDCQFVPRAAGNGVIVHSSKDVGLVVVDRSTVPVNGGNITLSFGAYPDELPARVRFLHPLHNFAIVSYDPCSLSHQVGFNLTVCDNSCTCGSIPESRNLVMKLSSYNAAWQLKCDLTLAVASAMFCWQK